MQLVVSAMVLYSSQRSEQNVEGHFRVIGVLEPGENLIYNMQDVYEQKEN
jgi:hypothetical protein